MPPAHSTQAYPQLITGRGTQLLTSEDPQGKKVYHTRHRQLIRQDRHPQRHQLNIALHMTHDIDPALLPTVTVEHDLNPPPPYTQTVQLHASIVAPSSTTPTSISGPKRQGMPPEEIIFIVTVSLLVLVSSFVCALILTSRFNNGCPGRGRHWIRNFCIRIGFSGISRNSGPTKEHFLDDDVKWCMATISNDGSLRKSEDSLRDMDDKFVCGSLGHTGVQITPDAPHLSCESYPLSSGTLVTEPIRSADNLQFEDRLRNEEEDITLALKYALRDFGLEKTWVDPVLNKANSLERRLSSAYYLEEESYTLALLDMIGNPGISVEAEPASPFSVEISGFDSDKALSCEIKRTQTKNLEMVKGVLETWCSHEVQQTAEENPDTVATKADKTISISTSQDVSLALAALYMEEYGEISLLPMPLPSLIVTHPSSNGLSLPSSSSSVTVDLKDFPMPPSPFPGLAGATGEDADRSTVNQTHWAVNQFITMYENGSLM